MADKQVMILTVEGFQKLKDELDYLQKVKRREIAEKIKVALSFGDLSENSEYDEAKNEQGIMESRIAELENIISNAEVVDSSDISTDDIKVGNRVVLKNIETGKVLEFRIVGPTESNKKEGKISNESPIGKACLGKAKGDVIDVEAPIGIVKYEIMDILK